MPITSHLPSIRGLYLLLATDKNRFVNHGFLQKLVEKFNGVIETLTAELNEKITYGTEPMTPGVSYLKTGTIYIQYEE